MLDPEVFKGTTWVDIKTVHDLTKMLETQLKDQNKGLSAIHRRLAEFGTEHEGVWIYVSGDDDEREYRQRGAEAEAMHQREFENELFGVDRRANHIQEPAHDDNSNSNNDQNGEQ